MTAFDATASFIDKWQARWPEWRIGVAFIPAPQRETAFAWFALLQELTDAAWSGADPTPGLAKLAWWNDELRGWTRGARRHPLGEVLQARAAPWEALAGSLLALQATRDLPPAEGSFDPGLRVFAAAVARCEDAIFDAGERVAPDCDGPAFDLRAERALLLGAAGTVDGPDARPRPCGPRPRRLHSAFLRERLRRAAAGASAQAPLRTLWLAWRAARGAS